MKKRPKIKVDTVKNGYTILNISYMNVEIEAEVQQNDNADVEILAPTDGASDVAREPVAIVAEPEKKDESMVVPIVVISLSIVVVIAAVVSAIVLARKKGKSSAGNNAAPATEIPAGGHRYSFLQGMLGPIPCTAQCQGKDLSVPNLEFRCSMRF